MAIDLAKINLNKNKVIDLKKKANIESSKAQVVLVLDYSISMNGLYQNGTVQKTTEKILPLGLAFDDNGEVDTYLFHNSSYRVKSPITLQNLDGYVNSNIIGKYNMGGTDYAPVLNQVFNDFKPSKGFLGLGKQKPMDYPVYVIFITDGANYDERATEEIIREMSNYGFFIQFVGIGNEKFNFLERLDDLTGRKIDNVNFMKIKDIATISEDELYQGLMAEYPGWVKQAESLNLIKTQ